MIERKVFDKGEKARAAVTFLYPCSWEFVKEASQKEAILELSFERCMCPDMITDNIY